MSPVSPGVDDPGREHPAPDLGRSEALVDRHVLKHDADEANPLCKPVLTPRTQSVSSAPHPTAWRPKLSSPSARIPPAPAPILSAPTSLSLGTGQKPPPAGHATFPIAGAAERFSSTDCIQSARGSTSGQSSAFFSPSASDTILFVELNRSAVGVDRRSVADRCC